MKSSIVLSINNLSVSVTDKQILTDVCLSIASGEIHAIMGPNGSGKSSLAYTIMGHSHYVVMQGDVLLGAENITDSAPHERARLGLFLSFQNPPEIPGVSVFSFLKEAYAAVKNVQISAVDFKQILMQRCEQLAIDQLFLSRSLNEGFSGGEKKRFEMLQLLVLQPQVAILDEIDSGLDIDALKIVAQAIEIARQDNPLMSILLITHYRRILEYVRPSAVHVLYNGTIVASGDYSLVTLLEAEGYDGFKK